MTSHQKSTAEVVIIGIDIGKTAFHLIGQDQHYSSEYQDSNINYPTVPRGTERIRLCPSPVHSRTDIHDFYSRCEGDRWVMAKHDSESGHSSPNQHAPGCGA